MTDRELMKMALDALVEHEGNYKLGNEGVDRHIKAVTALRERLAQPEQEPVAYAVYHRMGGGKSLHWPEQHSPDGDANAYQLAPLYTTPPQRKPLTDEQISAASKGHMTRNGFARAIEAAHNIKENT